MTITRPEALLLLLLLLPVLWWHRRRRAGPEGFRIAPVVIGIRVLVFALLVAALARPVIEREHEARHRVIVVDVSDSMGDLPAIQAAVDEVIRSVPEAEKLRLVTFADRAQEIEPAPRRPRQFPPLTRSGLRTDRSRLAAGLDLALALIPTEAGGAVTLISDGRESRGSVREAVGLLSARHIPLDARVIGDSAPGPVLREAHVPCQAPVGTPIDVVVEVESAVDGVVEARLRERAHSVSEKKVAVAIENGRGRAVLRQEIETEGLNRFRLSLHDASEREVPESAQTLAVHGLAPRTVWLVEGEGTETVLPATRRLLGRGARVTRKPAESLTGREDLSGVDYLVIADVPAAALAPAFLNTLAGAVEGGLGLLVTGGERSFGPGGYTGTPLERILPVRFQQKEERRDPSATLVIIIDTSGSMSGARIQLAKETARLALRRLKPHDKAGIVEFHGAKRWAAPIQPASNAVDLQRALNRLNAGGGTVILPAIEEAYYALLNVRTRTRHVLVLTDGGVEQGPFERLIRNMADKGMTLSTVLVGPGTHSAFLVSLAQWGRGRYYHAPDRFNMPEVIVKQPESSLLSAAIEEPTGLRVVGDTFIGREIPVADDLKLSGLLEVEARPTADVLLETARGEPLLCRWRYGLGQVSAWMSELSGPWTRQLARWPGYPRLFTGLFREGTRLGRPDRVRLRAEAERDRVVVFAWRDLDDGRPVDITVRLGSGEGVARRRGLLTDARGSGMDAPRGRVFDGVRSGVVSIAAESTDGRFRTRGALGVQTEREWTRARPDRARLAGYAALTGGRSDGALTPSPGRTRLEAVPLWRHCLWLALSAFLLLVLIRRLAPRRLPALVLVVLAVLGGPARGQEKVGVSEEVRKGIAVAAARPDTADGRRALREAIRRTRLQHGSLEALIRYLEDRAVKGEGEARLLAQVASTDGRPERARRILGDLEVGGRLDGGGQAEYARILEMLGREGEALAQLDRAIEAAPDPATAFALRIRKAGLLLSAGKQAGLEPLREIVAEHPGNADLRHYVALLAGLYGFPDLYDGLEARSPSRVAFRDHLIMGTFALRAGNLDDAKRNFLGALTSAGLTRDRRYAQERLITAHRRAGTLGALADRWLRDANRTPERVDALIAVLRELRRPEEALELLLAGEGMGDEATKKQRPFRSLQREIIGLALECNQPGKVEQTYRAIIEREPQRIEWRSGLALLYLLRGEREGAARVFRAGLEAVATSGKRVMRLAQAARDLSLEAEARHAARRAIGLDRETRLRAHLFLVDLDFKAGDASAAVQRLKTIEKEYHDEDEALAQVSDAYERMKRPQDSIRILTEIEKRSSVEDVLMRLAWLHQERRENDRALVLWKKLWRATKLPARVRQAEDRLLDLTSNTGRLADLAIDLEESLETGKGDARTLGLLVKLYSRASDPVSAVEVLKLYGPRMGKGEIETLQSMAHVYQHCMDYRRYEQTLEKLQALDPENALDYQQQIAMGALERGRGRQAKRALERLRAMAPGDVQAEEFAAGVLAMVGLLDDSVRSYTRVVAAHPDRIEDFLLLANVMRDDGRREQALRMFLDLLERADRDDLFTVAVDGLLNLRADSRMLRIAERRVKERIARRPHKAFLYQLAADIGEELRNVDEQVSLTGLMVIVAGERRSAVLRELMDLEAGRRRFKGMIDYGRSLLALGEEMPPRVFLDLGQALIRIGDLATAERVFARTRIAGDFASMQRRIAGYYEEAGYVADAGRILRQALLARPDDVALLVQVGTLSEVAGDRDQAERDFRRALDILIRRSPGGIGKPRKKKEAEAVRPGRARAAGSGVGRVVRFSSFSRNRNVDEYQRFSNGVIGGLMSSVRPPATALLKDMESRIRRELERLETSNELREELKNNPRLHRLVTFTRQAALLFDQPAVANRIDAHVLAGFPDDAKERRNAVQERARTGFTKHASELAVSLKLDLKKTFRTLFLDRELKKKDAIEKLFEGNAIEVSRAASLLPPLLTAGRIAEVKRILAAADVNEAKLNAGVVQTFVKSAIALEDPDAFARWSRRWLNTILETTNPRSLTQYLHRYFQTTWGMMGPEARDRTWRRLTSAADKASNKKEAALTGFLFGMGERIGRPYQADYEVFEQLIKQAPKSLYSVQPILVSAPAAYRSRLFKIVLGRLPERGRRHQILNLVTSFPAALDEGTVADLVRAFREAKVDKNYPVTGYYYRASRLSATTSNPRLALEIVRVLGKDHAGTGVFDLAAATLLARIGDLPAAEKSLEHAIKSMIKRGKLEGYERTVVNQIVNGVDSPLRSALERILAGLDDKGSVVQVLLETSLDQRKGRLEAAARRLAATCAKHPGDSTLRNAYMGVLRRLGRLAEATEIQARWLARQIADNTYAYRGLAEDYRRLDRPREALESIRKVKRGVVETLEIFLLGKLSRDSEMREAYRRFTSQFRKRRVYVSANWPLPIDKGGLAGSRRATDPYRNVIIFGGFGQDPRRTIYWHLATEPWGAEELAAAWRASSYNVYRPGNVQLQSLARARFEKMGRDGTIRYLEARAAGGELPAVDIELLLLLIADPGGELGPRIAPCFDLLRSYVLVNGSYRLDLMRKLADLYVRLGENQEARCLYRYLVVDRMGQPYFRGPARSLHALIDAYVDTYPEAERTDRRRALLTTIEGAWLAPPASNLERVGFLLDEWEKTGDPVAIDRYRATVQAVLDAAPEYSLRSSTAARLRGRLALYHARRGDLDRFEAEVGDILAQNLAWSGRFALSSIRSLLPDPERAGDAGPLAAALEKGLEKMLGRDDLAAVRIHLAGWLAEAGALEPARALLDRAWPDRGKQASELLVLADTARMVGEADRAYGVEKSLLERRALNVRRAPGLLDEIARRESQTAADRAAIGLAEYTDHPPVLIRAVRAEIRAGRREEAQALLDRLAAVAPQDPAVDELTRRLDSSGPR